MTAAYEAFRAAKAVDVVLELGTKRSEANRPTHHQDWAPDAAWVMLDVEEGLDVDVVGDAHALPFPDLYFDGYVACSVYEHLERPWIAAHEAARVLRPGGVAYVQTHQTFPIHGYPSDFWRYTVEALTLLFADAGMEVLSAGYEYPCTIVPPTEDLERGWNTVAPAFLNVDAALRNPLPVHRQGWRPTVAKRMAGAGAPG